MTTKLIALVNGVQVAIDNYVVYRDEDQGNNASDSDTLQSILTELKILNKAIALSLLNGDSVGEEDI